MADQVRVLLCDDHSIVREGLKAVLSGAEFVVVGEASTGNEALEAVERLQPDVVLLDLQMPGMTGTEAAVEILANYPRIKVMALTTFADEKSVVECMKIGVHAYIIKDVEKLELKDHIRKVLRGEAVIDPKVTGVLMARVRKGPAPASERADSPLSPQQMVILKLVAQGHSNREVADTIGLSENTVKGHVAEILHRLGVKNRVEAAIHASAKGWL